VVFRASADRETKVSAAQLKENKNFQTPWWIVLLLHANLQQAPRWRKNEVGPLQQGWRIYMRKLKYCIGGYEGCFNCRDVLLAKDYLSTPSFTHDETQWRKFDLFCPPPIRFTFSCFLRTNHWHPNYMFWSTDLLNFVGFTEFCSSLQQSECPVSFLLILSALQTACIVCPVQNPTGLLDWRPTLRLSRGSQDISAP
jgi:hypothetical protein